MSSINDFQDARGIAQTDAMMDAINAAQRICRETGIAGYAIETLHGWMASERKPSLRFGRVLECHIDGTVRYA